MSEQDMQNQTPEPAAQVEPQVAPQAVAAPQPEPQVTAQAVAAPQPEPQVTAQAAAQPAPQAAPQAAPQPAGAPPTAQGAPVPPPFASPQATFTPQPAPQPVFVPAPLQQLTGGMKFAWAVIGALLGIPGVVLAWVCNADKIPAVKNDAVKFSVIGFAIWIALGVVAGLAIGGITAAALFGTLGAYL